MEEDIGKRLRDTADRVIKAYEAWDKGGDIATRGELMDAVHELRKVASRVEIEVAVSERDEMTARPLPIPPHRASSRGRQGSEGGADQGDAQPEHAGGGQPRRAPQRRAPRSTGDDDRGNS